MSSAPDIIPVVAAVLHDGKGRLLIARRPAHKRHGGLWEFPGGKVHPGETLAQAVARELQEELGLQTTWVAREAVFEQQDPGQPFRIRFVEARAQGRLELLEHSDVAWVGIPVPDRYTLAPSDAAFVAALARGGVRTGAAPASDVA